MSDSVNSGSSHVLMIAGSDLARAIDQALVAAPEECCGILAGHGGGHVTRVLPMTNSLGRADAFLMDASEQFAACDTIQTMGLEMLAIYHSHPASAARPSAHDVAMAFYPKLAHMIVSLERERPVVKAFSIVKGTVREIPLLVKWGQP